MHHHQEDLDWGALGDHLERGAELDRGFLGGATDWLTSLADGREVARVLDVGSGPGVASCLLARAFPGAEVVAVDASANLLERAQARAEREGLSGRVVTQLADLPDGFDALGTADLVWTSHALHHLGDQQAALSRLGGLLRPGGLLALAEGGLPQRYLPRDIGIGRAGLQSRLEAAREQWFAAMRESLPGSAAAVEDWPAMLARSGLTHVGTRSFLTDLPAPVGADVREHVRDNLARHREEAETYLDADDVATLDRLVDPDAPDGILHRPDVFLLTASTVYVARAD